MSIENFRNPVGDVQISLDDTVRATSVREVMELGFIRCYDLLHGDDFMLRQAVTTYEVHELREQFHKVVLAAFQSSFVGGLYVPGTAIDQEYVLDHTENFDGKIVEDATDVGVGIDSSGDPDFVVRWRLTQISADGELVFGFQHVRNRDDIALLHQFVVSPNVIGELGAARLVEGKLKPFIVAARHAHLYADIDNIVDWCDYVELYAEAGVINALQLALRTGSASALNKLCEAFLAIQSTFTRDDTPGPRSDDDGGTSLSIVRDYP